MRTSRLPDPTGDQWLLWPALLDHSGGAVLSEFGGSECGIYTRRSWFDPFPLFDNFRIRRVNDFAHFRKHFPAPVIEFLDPAVEYCRGRF